MARLHQNNFATNLTSGTSAGATTSPLNSIPSIAAPFYLAFDATNINGHYEVVDCTSKTATNVLHAATSYDHTTAEEVRMIVPAVELDSFVTNAGTAGVISLNAPQGFLINGKISVTDAAGITVAIKTLAGTDPSATDPVYVRIGDTVRTLSSALTLSAADGTNWLNMGSAELATKEVDLFTYLTWDSVNSAVVLSVHRVPYLGTVADFTQSSTSEKGVINSSGVTWTNTDNMELIGRFAATLSAGAGYTWTVPTYTGTNLIQRPIYETRWLTWTPTVNWTGGTAPTTPTTDARYMVRGRQVFFRFKQENTGAGVSNTGANASLPFNVANSDASEYTVTLSGNASTAAAGTAPTHGLNHATIYDVGPMYAVFPSALATRCWWMKGDYEI